MSCVSVLLCLVFWHRASGLLCVQIVQSAVHLANFNRGHLEASKRTTIIIVIIIMISSMVAISVVVIVVTAPDLSTAHAHVPGDSARSRTCGARSHITIRLRALRRTCLEATTRLVRHILSTVLRVTSLGDVSCQPFNGWQLALGRVMAPVDCKAPS